MSLEERIKNGTARIAVIGLGYVGLPLAVLFARAGFPTVGIDSNRARIDQIRSGVSGIEDLPNAELEGLEGFIATAELDALATADVAIVCVQTPLNDRREPDLGAVESALDAISEHQHAGMLVVIESTVYPGATRSLCEIRLRPFELGEEVFVGFSPERVDPGTGRDLQAIPKIVAGLTPRCAALTEELYRSVFFEVVSVSSVECAEMVKLTENTFRAVNIALANEMGEICRNMGLDPFEVVRAAASKPYGFMPFYPGPGVGGHCIPIDPVYLAWRVRAAGGSAQFIELSDRINRSMPGHTIERVVRALNERSLAVRGASILIYGLSYKPGIADVRESPAIEIIGELTDLGAAVEVMDPRVPEIQVRGRSYRTTTRGFGDFDLVVVVTDHPELDVEKLELEAEAIVDTRGICGKGKRN